MEREFFPYSNRRGVRGNGVIAQNLISRFIKEP